MSTTTVLIPCLVDDCQEIITAEFEAGEPQTYEHPGSPDWWYAYAHGSYMHDDTYSEDGSDQARAIEHLNILDRDRHIGNSFQQRCSDTAVSSWDSEYIADVYAADMAEIPF